MYRLGLSTLLIVTLIGLLASTAHAEGLVDPIPAPIPKSSIAIELETIASGLVAPNLVVHAGDGSGRLFVVDQSGQVQLLVGDALQASPYLDVSTELVALRPSFDERGLLGLAFHPGFAESGSAGFGRFYTYQSEAVGPDADFTVPLPPATTPDHQAVVMEWTADDPASNAFAGQSRELMRIDEPQFNHNGGMLVFDPDGHLYVALGDGGSADDEAPGHTDGVGNGQDRSNVLGSILRIDPLGSNSANGAYGIPTGNPFVTDASTPDEIFAYGVRNPFRISVEEDPESGAPVLIVADVGQNDIEEISKIDIATQGGANLGWSLKEGSFRFEGGGEAVDGFVTSDLTGLPADLLEPIAEYDHDEGISVIGGFVYQGSAVPQLVGKYVFGDFLSGASGRLFVLDLESGVIEELQIGADDRSLGSFVKGFGRDAAGEIYVATGSSFGPSGTTGLVQRIVPVPEPGSLLLVGTGLALLGRRCRR